VNAPEGISLGEIYARNDTARHIIAGAASALPAARDLWTLVDAALADAPALGAAIERLAAGGPMRRECLAPARPDWTVQPEPVVTQALTL
jgi:hypothetical protein